MRLAVLLPLIALVGIATVRPVTAERTPPRIAARSVTTITGVVFDSLEMRGLAGATVQIADAKGGPWSRTTTSDAAGGFTFTDVPVGVYLLGFFHPKLDSLALASQILRVDVRTEQPMQARLALPS